jgi:hypothetical protein
MADEVWTGVRPGDAMDDDRLLAFALGLDDDPELVRAAAGDDALARRLEAVRADVASVKHGVLAAVPNTDDSYSDLSDARWAGLQEYFTSAAEPPAAKSHRPRRWLRVLAPVVAVALAVAVGVSVIERQSGQQTDVASRSAKSSESLGTAAGGAPVAATSALPGYGAASSGGSTSSAGGAPVPAGSYGRLAALHEQMSDFAVIVLATARSASDGFQNFIVVRVLRGNSPKMLRLKLAGRLADVGRLHLVLLRPFSESQSVPLPAASDSAGGVATETSSTAVINVAEAEMLTSTVPVVYTFEGTMAVARELPDGTDAATITLP